MRLGISRHRMAICTLVQTPVPLSLTHESVAGPRKPSPPEKVPQVTESGQEERLLSGQILPHCGGCSELGSQTLGGLCETTQLSDGKSENGLDRLHCR